MTNPLSNDHTRKRHRRRQLRYCCDTVSRTTSPRRSQQRVRLELLRTILQIATHLFQLIVVVATATTSSTSHYQSSTNECRIRGNSACVISNPFRHLDGFGTSRHTHNFSKNRRYFNKQLQTGHDRSTARKLCSDHRLSFIPSLQRRERQDRNQGKYCVLSMRNDEGEDADSFMAISSMTPSFNINPTSSSSSEVDVTTPTDLITTQLEVLQTIILQQQRQIDTLLKMLQQQSSSSTPLSVINNGDRDFIYNNSPQMTPPLFQPLRSMTDDDTTKITSTTKPTTSTVQKLKAMLFIDGTWLYYSINERLAKDASIIQKYGRGWQHRYDIDWTKLPNILCTMLQSEIQTFQDGNSKNDNVAHSVEVDLVHSMVYTSYKADTSTTSYRYKLFQDLKKANFSVHMMETVGKSEKCVDIQLAVEILHYATLENPTNSYDIALLLTGDKDLMPAIIRTRCKGKQVGLVSMRPGCNRALVDTPGLLDFDVIWMEDLLDQLLIPRMLDDAIDDADSNESTAGVSMYTLHKVVYDFIKHSQLKKVSSRDLGRYLKQTIINDVGGGTLLDTMKKYFGGMYQYLSSMGYYDCDLPPFDPGTADYSYWISFHHTSNIDAGFDEKFDDQNDADIDDRDDDENFFLDKPSDVTRLTESEKVFFSKYSVERLIRDRQTLYLYSLEGQSESVPSSNVSDRTNSEIPSNNVINRTNTEKESFSITSIQKVVDDFVIHSGCDRIVLSDLKNYLRHLQVTRSFSFLNEVNRIYGNLLNFLKSVKGYYTIESGERADIVWIQLGNSIKAGNETFVTRRSETERNFFMKYTVEPLIISRQRWYCNTLSAVAENIQNPIDSKSNTSIYFSELTVADLKQACRERGLALSGTKAALLERLQAYVKTETASDNNDSNQTIIPEIILYHKPSTYKYLRDLVEEYLHAKGGIANSRMIGRYLAANKATNPGKRNALQELKAQYGSLNSFVTKNADLFALVRDRPNTGSDGNDDVTDNYAFSIALKKKEV